MDKNSQYTEIMKMLKIIDRRLASIENRMALTGPGILPKPPTPPFVPMQLPVPHDKFIP